MYVYSVGKELVKRRSFNSILCVLLFAFKKLKYKVNLRKRLYNFDLVYTVFLHVWFIEPLSRAC